MNQEDDYASDSDQSDEDFCPEKAAENSDAEAASGDEDESDAESDDSGGEEEEQNKRGKTAKGSGKSETSLNKSAAASGEDKRSTRQSEADQNGRSAAAKEKDELDSDDETDKSRSNALWADFLNDVGDEPKTETKTSAKPKEKPAKTPTKPVEEQPKTKVVTEVLDFAGEQVTVEKTVSVKENQQQAAAPSSKTASPHGFGIPAKRPANGNAGGAGGLGSLLNQLGKKKKLSVLEKSQMDWKSFKNDEGIDEQLQTHNKGKDGYLERQDFLQRTDLRQFEIEKNLRQTRRQN